jgi:hypothetical protein
VVACCSAQPMCGVRGEGAEGRTRNGQESALVKRNPDSVHLVAAQLPHDACVMNSITTAEWVNDSLVQPTFVRCRLAPLRLRHAETSAST